MSKKVPVEFGDKWLSAFDVSLAVLLLESVLIAREATTDGRPGWLDEIVEELETRALLGANQALLLDQSSDQKCEHVLQWITEASRRLRQQWMSAEDAERRYTVAGEPIELRGRDPVDVAAAADLGDAIVSLVRGDLPETKLGGSCILGLPTAPPSSDIRRSGGDRGRAARRPDPATFCELGAVFIEVIGDRPLPDDVDRTDVEDSRPFSGRTAR